MMNVVNVLFPPFSAMMLSEITDNFEIFPETPLYIFPSSQNDNHFLAELYSPGLAPRPKNGLQGQQVLLQMNMQGRRLRMDVENTTEHPRTTRRGSKPI